MGRMLALIGALIAAALIAWVGERTPSPNPAGAPATAFSADRAMADIKAFASVPHPVGSDADRAAREYIQRRMLALGLSPQVKAGAGVYTPKAVDNFITGGFAEDVVGVLPGRDPSLPALALMAHYDSVPASSGASDDAAGAASALEIVRAIKARGVPARDVVVLITDGEEAGLLGADAYFRTDPKAKHVGYIMNMEARGSAGRVQMFQTNDANGGDIRKLKANSPAAQASSLTGYIYDRMPNDTDFTVSKRAGVPGLNYGFIGHQFDYHSPSSTPATQDMGSLQDMGDAVLPTAAAIASSPTLPARSASLVYANVPGGLLVAYPPVVGWLILAAAAGLIVWAAIRARRKEPWPWLDLARGAGAALFAVATGGALMNLARVLTGARMGYVEQRFLLAQAPRWEIALFLCATGVALLAAAHTARGKRWLIALLPLAAGVAAFALNPGGAKTPLIEGVVGALLALAVYGRPASRPGAWLGVLGLGLVLGVAAQALAPAAGFVVAWPLAWAALAAMLTAAAAHRGTAPIVVLAVFAAVGLGFAGEFAHAGYLSLDLPELLCLPLFLSLLSLWPLAQTEEGAPPARLLGPALIIAGLAVTLAVRFNHPFDARHPDATLVVYDIDQDARKAWRASLTPEANAWTRGVLTADGGNVAPRTVGPRESKAQAAPAPYLDLPAPQLTAAKDAAGDLVVHVVPPPGGRVIELKLTTDTAVKVVAVGGVPMDRQIKPGPKGEIVRWSAAQPGFDVVVRPGGPGKLAVSYAAWIERWPAAARPLPPRPKDVMPFDMSDSTLLEGARSFSW
jgi:hypothetical protein